MIRLIAGAAFLFIGTLAQADAPMTVEHGQSIETESQSCCRVCTDSQACGDSCISWDKTCHQPPGCACQG